MAKSPAHEWLGTIAIGSVEIGVRAYSAFGHSTPPTIYKVHKELCAHHSQKQAKDSSTGKRASGNKKPKANVDDSRGRVITQDVCARCLTPLNPDEIGWEITTKTGIKIPLGANDFKTMSFERSDRVEARIVDERDPTLASIGFGRAFYLFPEPASVENYWVAFKGLHKMGMMGFIPLIAFQADRAYRAVIRPMILSPELFGEEIQTSDSRKVLMLWCVNDTDTLKDPRDFPRYPNEAHIPSEASSRLKVKAIESVLASECVNPKTEPIFRAMRNARQRALRS